MTNAKIYLDYFNECLEKNKANPSDLVNPFWVIEMLELIDASDKEGHKINPAYLRAEFEVSFDGVKRSQAIFVSI